MKILERKTLDPHLLPGRKIQKAVGKDGASTSEKITMGFARYSAESGPMSPHRHAEEIVYILDAQDGWVEFGSGESDLPHRVTLHAGMTLHIPEQEWHVFRFGEGGFVDIIFIYGQVDDIRPEEASTPQE